MNAAVDELMRPTRTPQGNPQPELHPLGDRVRETVMSSILKQLCDVVQQGGTISLGEAEILMEPTEFIASKEQYTALKQELDEFREAAGVSVTQPFPEASIDGPHATQTLRQSRPAPLEQLEELDATYSTALQRCRNAKDVYDTRCKVSCRSKWIASGSLTPTRRSVNVRTVSGYVFVVISIN